MGTLGGIFNGYLNLFSGLEKSLFLDIYPIVAKELREIFRNSKTNVYERDVYTCEASEEYYFDDANEIQLLNVDRNKEDKFEACEKNIQKILDLLKTANNARNEFLTVFPDWEKQRNANIEQLREVAKSIRTSKSYCSAAKIAASTIGVAGGAAIIGSLIFPPLAPAILPAWLGGATVTALLPSFLLPTTVAVTSPLAVAGGIAAGAGGVSNLTATVSEIKLIQKQVDKAKDICASDQLNFKKIEKWFLHTKQLASAVDELVKLDIMDSVLREMRDILREHTAIDVTDPSSYMDLLKYFIATMATKVNLVYRYGFKHAVAITGVLFVVFVINSRNRFVFRCTMQTRDFCLGLACFADAGVQIGRLIAAASLQGTAAAELIPKVLAQRIAVGAMAGVGIGLDFVNIVLSSMDLAKGSLSDEEKMIVELANNLKEELDAIKQVYSDMVLILIDKYS